MMGGLSASLVTITCSEMCCMQYNTYVNVTIFTHIHWNIVSPPYLPADVDTKRMTCMVSDGCVSLCATCGRYGCWRVGANWPTAVSSMPWTLAPWILLLRIWDKKFNHLLNVLLTLNMRQVIPILVDKITTQVKDGELLYCSPSIRLSIEWQ